MAGSRLRPSGCGIDARTRASRDRILLEQPGDHCGVEIGADVCDHVVAEIDDPAITVVDAGLCRRGRRSRRRAQRLCLLLQVAGTPASTGTRRGWPEYVPHRAFGVSLSTRAVASRRANAAASSLSRLSPGDDDLRSRTPCAYNAKSRSSLIFSLLFVNTFVADFVICQEVSARDVPARLPADVTRCVVAQLSTCVEMSTLARTSNACFFIRA